MKSRKAVFWSKFQLIIKKVTLEFDKQWQVRKRVLNTQFLVFFILKLIMSKNKQGYNSVVQELWNSDLLDKGLNLPQKYPLAASSICEARQKMPENVFKAMNEEIITYWQQENYPILWCGHRVFAVDGSKINLPHELVNEGYKIQSIAQRHYPTGLMSVLYNLGDRMVYDFALEPHLDERLCAIKHMDKMSQGDILVLDRGYFSYLLLYKGVEKNIHIVCRIQPGNINKEFKKFLNSKRTDTIINYEPSDPVKSKLRQRGFNLDFKKISIRLIKYKIDAKLYICATTLLSKNYSITQFARLYHGRWGVEELYKISKQHIDVEDFHSKTERGVKQELYAHLFLINIARIFETEAKNKLPSSSSKPSIKQKDSYWQDFYESLQGIKINFKNCLLVIGRYLERLFLKTSYAIRTWLPKAIFAIASVKQRIRPGRHYPRHSYKPIKKWASGINKRKV